MTVAARHDQQDQLDALRDRVAAWARDRVPRDWRDRLSVASEAEWVEFHRDWFATLQGGGFAAPHLPREWGGGYSLREQVVIQEELARADAPDPRLHTISLHHLPATLLQFGTPEQQRVHLEGMRRGVVWCQGFSEPEAGSDLASLRTRAVRDGDDYVVSGQKVWTSLGFFADWCLLLVRTNPDAPKRHGISYLMMDMRSPGVDVRPIRQMTGEAEFCEVFLDQVRIPLSNLIGEENRGWQVTQATLSEERGAITLGYVVRLERAFRLLLATARSSGDDAGRSRVADPLVRDRIVRLYERIEMAQLLCYDLIDRTAAGEQIGAESAVIKIYFSQLVQALTETGVDLSGLAGQISRARPLGDITQSGVWMTDYLNSWLWTISGGTNEVLRTLVGERALGLPRDPGM
jgi:alkylation response protein AidB-like acyl-CoA dehydrogenase